MHSQQALVSILMPAKNAAAHLQECMDAILAQGFQDWELVVVDDHSEDDTLLLLTDYASKDPRILLLKNKEKGIIPALRMAYQHASGTYITRMDADDIMTENKIECLHQQLSTKGKGYLAVGLVHYFSEKELGQGYRAYAAWLNSLSCSETNFEDIYKECTIPSPCWMIHRDDLDACQAFQPNTYPEDYDLAFRFRKKELKITTVKQVLHHWRDHETRTSRNDPHYADNQFADLKIQHFLDQDLDEKTPLVLWGAGRKAKKIASLLVAQNVRFNWVCNNENKLGKDIYGIILEDFKNLSKQSRSQVIVAVKSLDAADEIESFIQNHEQHEYFRFS